MQNARDQGSKFEAGKQYHQSGERCKHDQATDLSNLSAFYSVRSHERRNCHTKEQERTFAAPDAIVEVRSYREQARPETTGADVISHRHYGDER